LQRVENLTPPNYISHVIYGRDSAKCLAHSIVLSRNLKKVQVHPLSCDI